MDCRKILHKGDYTLVEVSPIERYWVPSSSVTELKGDRVDVDAPEEGVPFGLNIAHMEAPKFNMVELDSQLKRRGIWTAGDLRRHPQEVVSALQSALGISYADLIVLAEQQEKST